MNEKIEKIYKQQKLEALFNKLQQPELMNVFKRLAVR